MEIHVSPPILLDQVRQALPSLFAAVPRLSRLQATAEDPKKSLRGLLGYFSSAQVDLIESLFVTMGEPNTWGYIIKLLWAAHLSDVEEALDLAAESRAVFPSEESSLSPQLLL